MKLYSVTFRIIATEKYVTVSFSIFCGIENYFFSLANLSQLSERLKTVFECVRVN